MNLSQKQLMIIGFGGAIAVIFAILVIFNLRPGKVTQSQLVVAGFDKGDAFAAAIAGFSQLYPAVKVVYEQVGKDNYDNNLLSALASGQGPDVFPIHNRGIAKSTGILYPAPATQFDSGKVDGFFPPEVGSDLVYGGQVYALPFYFDTLSLIYNKDLFDQAGIASPPSSWEEFQLDVQKLRNVSANGQIATAGAAIGGSSKTVTNAVDILTLLMLQNGVPMVNDRGVSFSSENGVGAFNFYLEFANPSSNYYTWNENQPNDIDNFSTGKTGMIFAYNSDVQKIRNKSPFLKFGVAPVPQVSQLNSVNYADYWGFGVSKQSRNPVAAWNFIIYATTQSQAAAQYSSSANQPPALRELIGQNLGNYLNGAFAKQALTARSWPQPDENQVESVFNGAISSVLGNQTTAQKALYQAEYQVGQIFKGQK